MFYAWTKTRKIPGNLLFQTYVKIHLLSSIILPKNKREVELNKELINFLRGGWVITQAACFA